MKIQNTKIWYLSFALSVFSFALFVSAQTDFTGNVGDYPGVASTTVVNLINLLLRLTCYVVRFGVISVGVAIVVYGIMFLLSRGNPQGWGNAKKALGWGIVGALVIFGVFTLILTVSDLVGYGASNYIPYPILRIVQCS